jgi:hypothetical protein
MEVYFFWELFFFPFWAFVLDSVSLLLCCSASLFSTFPCFSAFVVICFSASPLLCFSASLLLRFSAYPLCCLSAFLLFPAFPPFQLLCFSAFCFSLLLCLPAFVLLLNQA